MIAVSTPSYWDALSPTLVIGAAMAATLTWANRDNPVVRVLAVSLCLFVSWRYMGWRLTQTIPWNGTTLDLVAGLVFVAVEFLAMLSSTASTFFLSRFKSRTKQVDAALPRLRALARKPQVDVLICTYNEDKTILERTILGALAADWPNVRIWVCDDGRREWLGELCAQYGVTHLTRADNAHAKAGNINAALKRLAALETPPDFVCILDADFVPTPALIPRALALMEDVDVGVVQTPQHFFNPDPVQYNLHLSRVWPDEQRFFFDVVMPTKDAWGGAFCCGTSSLSRFTALQAIGGFPTDSVTEDYLLTLRMAEVGYKTVYLNERLSLGLAPEGLAEYCVQRSRWCLGFVQICRGRNGPFSAKTRIPLIHRVMLVESFFNWSAMYALRIACLFAPILYLLFDIQIVNAGVSDAISHVGPFLLVQITLFSWLTRWRVLPVMSELYQLIPALDVLKAVWAGLTRPQGQKFRVTAKGVSRDRRAVQWPLMRIFMAFIALTALSIARSFLFPTATVTHDAEGIALFWAWYNIAVLTLACFACFELRQSRSGDRFATDELVEVVYEGQTRRLNMVDVSISGARFIGPRAPRGAEVTVLFAGRHLRAVVARETPDGFAVAFEKTLEARKTAVQHVFSGRYAADAFAIEPRKVAGALLARLLR
jgi:cellulose synthase (UDP-forming)